MYCGAPIHQVLYTNTHIMRVCFRVCEGGEVGGWVCFWVGGGGGGDGGGG
jgi:hypothetical protein